MAESIPTAAVAELIAAIAATAAVPDGADREAWVTAVKSLRVTMRSLQESGLSEHLLVTESVWLRSQLEAVPS